MLSCVQLLVTPWTVDNQAPLSMGFSRQQYWSGVPLPSDWPILAKFHPEEQARHISSSSQFLWLIFGYLNSLT